MCIFGVSSIPFNIVPCAICEPCRRDVGKMGYRRLVSDMHQVVYLPEQAIPISGSAPRQGAAGLLKDPYTINTLEHGSI